MRVPSAKGEDHNRHMHDISLQLLALMLSRYDRSTAKAIPVIHREHSRTFNGASPYLRTYTLMCIDPDAALKWVDSLPDVEFMPGVSVESWETWSVARTLADDEIWSAGAQRDFHRKSHQSIQDFAAERVMGRFVR